MQPCPKLEAICAALQAGLSVRLVAKSYGLSFEAVLAIWEKLKGEGRLGPKRIGEPRKERLPVVGRKGGQVSDVDA